MVTAAAAVVLVVYAGAHLASLLGGDGRFRAGVVDAVGAAIGIPSSLGDPAAAWGPQHRTGLPGPALYYASLVMVLTAAGGLIAAGRLAWEATSARNHPLGVKPYAGLAGRRELSDLAVPAPEPGRLTLGLAAGTLVAAEPRASLAVVGPTGCGKSAGFAIPALLEWKGPVIVTSVKSDLIDAAIARRRQLGTVWLYDPSASTPEPGSKWSPLAASTTWAGAMRVAAWLCDAARPRIDSVTDGDYWYTQARKALAPLLYTAAVGGRTMADVVRWVDIQEEAEVREILLEQLGIPAEVEKALAGSEGEEERRRVEPMTRARVFADLREMLRSQPGRLARLADAALATWPVHLQEDFEARAEAEVEKKVRGILEDRLVAEARRGGEFAPLAAIEALWAKDRRIRDSVYASIQNFLLGYADPQVAEAAAGNEIDFDAWLAGANTIFVVAPSHEQARLRPVFTVLIQQAIRRAYETANEHGGTLEHPCLVLLDEAGNIAPLKSLPEYAATARSHGITFVSIWQDLAQIRALYGDRAPVVLNNHRAKIFGAGIADEDTLTYISRLLGEEEQLERNYSADVGGASRRSVSERISHRPLAPLDLVRRITPGEGLLLYGSLLPARLRFRPWYETPGLRELAEPPSQGSRPQAGSRSTAVSPGGISDTA